MGLEKNTPLAVQLARLLRYRLRREYADGGRLPSEPTLAEEFDVSRGTVRQALTILEREGAIYRKQGAGTFANKHVLRIRARAEHAYEFTELIRRSGFEARIKLVGITHETAGEELSELLEIEPDAEVLVVRKLFLADNAPSIYCIDVIPTSLIHEPYDETELHAPIFGFLKQRCHREVDYNLAEIMPDLADDQLAELLECSPNAVVLRLDETSYDQSNEPVLFSRVYYKADRIRFTVLRKKL